MNPTLDTPSQENVLKTLENLIEITRDGQRGFGEAAEHASDPELKQLFQRYSSERASILADLQGLERTFGKPDVDESGTVIGTMHRTWLNLRSAITSNNDQALLEEAERGEDAALEAYRDALDPKATGLHASPGVLPESVTAVIARHLAQVQEAHDTVRNFRDSGRFDKSA